MIAGFGSIRQSMGRTHCCFDNARMENFFATLKKELIYRLRCSSMKRDEVRRSFFAGSRPITTAADATPPTIIIYHIWSNMHASLIALSLLDNLLMGVRFS